MRNQASKPDSDYKASVALVDLSNLIYGAWELSGPLSLGALMQQLRNYDYSYVYHAEREELTLPATPAPGMNFIRYERLKNLDVAIALKGGEVLRRRDVGLLSLFSGDGDFIPLLLAARCRGVATEVVSFGSSLSPQLQELATRHRILGREMLAGPERPGTNGGLVPAAPPTPYSHVGRMVLARI